MSGRSTREETRSMPPVVQTNAGARLRSEMSLLPESLIPHVPAHGGEQNTYVFHSPNTCNEISEENAEHRAATGETGAEIHHDAEHPTASSPESGHRHEAAAGGALTGCVRLCDRGGGADSDSVTCTYRQQ